MASEFSLWHGLTTRYGSSAGALAETPLLLCMRHTPVVSPVQSALAGCRPDGHRDPAPGLAPRGAQGQMQDQSAHRPLDPDRQFQQAFAQTVPWACRRNSWSTT